ncbi:MAG: hypothetical protein FWH47_02190 [Methanomassiliicoccaceae archaeon]|nr:hypothetical protein [Methanomassiliicoccaceae archaeon]
MAEEVFAHTKDSKKAAGRALGTLVEIITYYVIKSWKMDENISIETRLAEYGNEEITHNVEFSLHPVRNTYRIEKMSTRALTPRAIFRELETFDNFVPEWYNLIPNRIIDNDIVRNACKIGTSRHTNLICNLKIEGGFCSVFVSEQEKHPFAMIECKRVGVEEGMKKGPQTIEKAKQGAYVARSVSSLQKIRTHDGVPQGIVYFSKNKYKTNDYDLLLEEIISSSEYDLYKDFTLTVGVVSNHGNWFTSENQNKEMKVLAQSYDWLLFLTDHGLSDFINTFILNPAEENMHVREAFLCSYTKNKKINQFTKVRMNQGAHLRLVDYFNDNKSDVEKWFSIISPQAGVMGDLRNDLLKLSSKRWTE